MALLDILLKFPAIKIAVVLTNPFLKIALQQIHTEKLYQRLGPISQSQYILLILCKNITVHRKVKRSCIKQIGKGLENVNQFKHLMQFT